MGGRDHSIECEVCGLGSGGLNDLKCDCEPLDPHAAFLLEVLAYEADCRERLDTLASNLAVGAALCRAYYNGLYGGENRGYYDDAPWRPGCGRMAL